MLTAHDIPEPLLRREVLHAERRKVRAGGAGVGGGRGSRVATPHEPRRRELLRRRRKVCWQLRYLFMIDQLQRVHHPRLVKERDQHNGLPRVALSVEVRL